MPIYIQIYNYSKNKTFMINLNIFSAMTLKTDLFYTILDHGHAGHFGWFFYSQ